MTESGEDLLGKALVAAIAELAGPKILLVFESGAEGIAVLRVRRDETGTPRGRADHPVPWAGDADVTAERALAIAEGIPGEPAVVIVCTAPEDGRARRAMECLHAAHPRALAFTEAGESVAELLRQAIIDQPLTQSYELVVLKRHPATGQLRLASLPLFGLESRRGDRVEFAVRCEPGDENGTVFAITAWQALRPALLSVHTAELPPGAHTIVAELERPGRVRFTGLPGLARCDTTWEELVAAVPQRLDRPAGPAHLICAVQVSGPEERVRARLDRVGQLLSTLADAQAGRTVVSLIAYGPHVFQRGAPDRPVTVPCWRSSPRRAQEALLLLEERHVRPPEAAGTRDYAYAAQVEDVLAEVTHRLGGDGRERTALLTVGDRPPHPPRANASEILPCPRRLDWEALLAGLENRLALGAICDQPPERAHPVWSRLGAAALAHLDAMDVDELGEALGLVASQGRRVPFPFSAAS
ncbi:hypothetical protein DQ384_29720 [Sphaerisporangium album]|uniref:Uncharacterized protein n=1 Tax=Sphaerisporangium album TaxID=509200 RepID=A0A367F715_9ACTN|nr:hypothetical protein [Sphaerisporangium album]RCG26158.1 hypothetical protein DQ384_29720 [Sphaerisporangium album]